MLHLLYTGQRLLELRRENLSRNSGDWLVAESGKMFHARRLKEVDFPTRGNQTVKTKIKLTIPKNCQRLVFGLLDCCLLPNPHPSPGVFVTVDLDAGVVKDILNGAGVIGYVDESRLAEQTEVELEVHLTRHGRNCIPTLLIAGERLMHPAIHMAVMEMLDLVAGSGMEDGFTSFPSWVATEMDDGPDVSLHA